MLIQLGDRGPSVTKIQRELLVTVTGIYDAATQSAVSAYQTSAGLTATGIVDLTTWWTLFPDDAAIVAGVEVAGTFSSSSTAKIPTTKAVADYVAAHGGGGGGGGIATSLATAADQGLYSTAANTWAVFSLTSAWRTFLSTVKAVWTEASGVLSVWGLQINTTPSVTPTAAVGQLIWDDTEGTITLGAKGGNVTIPVGTGQLTRVQNDDTVSLTPGQVVYLSGSNGSNTLAKRAQANAESTSATAIGLVAETIGTSQHGWVMISGILRNINTAHLTLGQLVWLSAAAAGDTTATQPAAPNHGVQIGLCVRVHATTGAILIAMQNGYELNELHNVRISSATTGDLLQYDGTLPAWKNVASIAQSQVTSLTTDLAAKLALAGGTMTGSLVLRTGSASAGTAPAKLVSGTLMTAPEAGAVEFATDNAYLTITTGTARKALVLADGTLTSGRVPFLTTNGRVADSANLTYSDAAATMTVSLSQNAQTGMQITNANAGGNAIAGIKCTSNASNCTIGASSSASTYAGAMVFYTPDAVAITFYNNGLRRATINSDGNLGVGVTNGTATLHLKAGSATSGTAPLKINSGTVMGTPETGAVEYDGTDWYLTNSMPARRTVAYLATVTTSSTPVTVPAIGGHVRVVGAAGAKTVTLPATSGVKSGTRVTIKDAAGNAASGTITVNAASTETIDGAASATITTNYGVLRLIYSGSTGRWETC